MPHQRGGSDLIARLHERETRRAEKRREAEIDRLRVTGGGRARVDAPAEIISPVEVQPPQAEPRPSFSQRFFSAVPTFARESVAIQQSQLQSNIEQFEALSPEEQLVAAREGRFGTTFIPAGQVERELGIAGTVGFETPRRESTISALRGRLRTGELLRDIAGFPTGRGALAGELFIGAAKGGVSGIEIIATQGGGGLIRPGEPLETARIFGVPVGLQRPSQAPFDRGVFRDIRQQPTTLVGSGAEIVGGTVVLSGIRPSAQFRPAAIEPIVQRGLLRDLESQTLFFEPLPVGRESLLFRGERATDFARQQIVGGQARIPGTDFSLGGQVSRTQVSEFGLFPGVPLTRPISRTEFGLPFARAGREVRGQPTVFITQQGQQFGATAVRVPTPRRPMEFLPRETESVLGLRFRGAEGRQVTGIDLLTGRRFGQPVFAREVPTRIGLVRREFLTGQLGEAPAFGGFFPRPPTTTPTIFRGTQGGLRIVRPFGRQEQVLTSRFQEASIGAQAATARTSLRRVSQGLPLIGAGAFPQLLRQPSAFAGTGLFERTQGGLAPPQIIQRQVPGAVFRQPGLITIPRGRERDIFGIRTTTVTTPGFREALSTRGLTTPSFGQRVGQAQRQIPLQRLVPPPTPTTLDRPFFRFPITPISPIPRRGRFGLGGILPGFGAGGGLRMPTTTRQRKKRQPSFAALFFDISAPEPARFERTGLVLRPILRR